MSCCMPYLHRDRSEGEGKIEPGWTMPLIPEVSGGSIVVVGEFSPRVFSPDWLVRQKLLAVEDADAAKVDLISFDVTQFSTDWLLVLVDRQRLQIQVKQDPLIRLFDLVMGLLPLFPEQPVQAVGLNRDVHVRLPTEDAWHRLGDMLAPKDPWPKEFLTFGGKRHGGLRALRDGTAARGALRIYAR